MWRKMPAVVGSLLFLIALGAYGYAFTIGSDSWRDTGGDVLIAGVLYQCLLQLKRLTSDWPPGLIFAAGAEAERRRRRRRARRGPVDVVSLRRDEML